MKTDLTEFDVIIVGGGAAGLSAALWCADLGIKSIVLEKNEAPGGQLRWIHTPIRNYPAIEASNGKDFLKRLLDQVAKRATDIQTSSVVAAADVVERVIVLKNGQRLNAKAIVIATGVRRRKLVVPGEDEFVGKGILETGQIGRELLKGKSVAIVGGGDAAFENADALSRYAETVYLLHRRSTFSARTSFIERVSGDPKIELTTEARVKEFGGSDHLESLEYVDANGNSHSLAIDAALIRIGVEPNTEFFRDSLELDSRGYVTVNHLGETSAKLVFAIGDVANPTAPTLASAIGMAATAVKTIRSQI
jgi:thioredoxin reductase (NADPH)